MNSTNFDKYERKGAYHWGDYFGGLRRMNAYTRARYDLVLDAARKLKLPTTSRILEVGCGDGALSGVLHAGLRLPVNGVDTSTAGLELARQMFAKHCYTGEFRQVSGYDTGFAQASFELVVCSDVIEHVDDPLEMLCEIQRVLTPGGWLIVTTPLRFSEQPMDPLHVQEWFAGEFAALCRTVFGEPARTVISHPVFWYELISASNPWVARVGRLVTNLLARLGRNPLMEHSGAWRCYTTQMLVLRNEQQPATPLAP